MEEKRTRVALRLVIVKNGKVLLSYNSRDNYYFYIGGRLEFGETIEEGAKREVREELGEETKFNFKKVLYIRDFIVPEKNTHNVELFMLGDINKFEELEHYPDPEHNGQNWATWADMDKLPDNLYPKLLTKKLVKDFLDGFTISGEYIGRMDAK